MICGDRDNDAILVLLGSTGGEGKTTLRERVTTAAGSYATAMNGDQVVGVRMEHKSSLMGLRTARVVGISELPVTGQSWRCALVKSITGGDTIQANWKYQNEVTFRPVCRLFITANSMPSAASTAAGMARRLRILRMEAVLPYDGSKAVIEADDMLPTIVRWLVDGARRYLSEGEGDVPPSVVREGELWAAENDLFRRFAEECGIVATGKADDFISRKAARRMFAEFCEEVGVKLPAAKVIEALRSPPWNAKAARKHGHGHVLTGLRHQPPAAEVDQSEDAPPLAPF